MYLLIPILFLLYFLGKNGSSKFGQSGNSYTTPLPGGVTQNPNGTTTISPTITQIRAESIAHQLREELGALITSDDIVVNLFKGLNQADFVMIYNEFGTMSRDFLSPQSSVILGTNRDLVWWLVDELSSNHLAKLKKQFPTVF